MGGGSLIFEWRWQNVLVLEKLFDFWAKISCSPKSPSSVSSHQSFDHQFKEVLCNLQNWPDAPMQQENGSRFRAFAGMTAMNRSRKQRELNWFPPPRESGNYPLEKVVETFRKDLEEYL